jgi:hypothetical protein
MTCNIALPNPKESKSPIMLAIKAGTRMMEVLPIKVRGV